MSWNDWWMKKGKNAHVLSTPYDILNRVLSRRQKNIQQSKQSTFHKISSIFRPFKVRKNDKRELITIIVHIGGYATMYNSSDCCINFHDNVRINIQRERRVH